MDWPFYSILFKLQCIEQIEQSLTKIWDTSDCPCDSVWFMRYTRFYHWRLWGKLHFDVFLLLARTNCWIQYRFASDLKCHDAHVIDAIRPHEFQVRPTMAIFFSETNSALTLYKHSELLPTMIEDTSCVLRLICEIPVPKFSSVIEKTVGDVTRVHDISSKGSEKAMVTYNLCDWAM